MSALWCLLVSAGAVIHNVLCQVSAIIQAPNEVAFTKCYLNDLLLLIAMTITSHNELR